MPGVRQWKFVLLASFLIILWAAGPLRADSGATAKVRSVLERAMGIQTDAGLQGSQHRKERAELIRKLISKNFNSPEMAKESMQEYWGRLSASQRDRYRTLLTGIFIDSYTRQVLDFLKQEKIQYPGESPRGKLHEGENRNNEDRRAHPRRLYYGTKQRPVDDKRCAD